MIKKKSIIFCAPADYGIAETITEALNNRGYIVHPILFEYSDFKFKYSSFNQRLINFLRKIFLRDFKYKEFIKIQQFQDKLIEKLRVIPHSDYALFIRPDLFNKEFIKLAKNKSNRLIGYQWDGLDRFPKVYNYLDYFDRFFVFDRKDINIDKKIFPLTNFYISSNLQIKNKSKLIYFIATYDDYRFELIKKLKDLFDHNNLKYSLTFITFNKDNINKLKDADFPIKGKIKYSENLKNVASSSTIIDIHCPEHLGLSFRVFEAINYSLKLITTNPTVLKYDFYNSNNIFFWDGTNTEQIIDFLNLPYVNIEDYIKQKYSFDNWINYILDIEPFNAISIP